MLHSWYAILSRAERVCHEARPEAATPSPSAGSLRSDVPAVPTFPPAAGQPHRPAAALLAVAAYLLAGVSRSLTRQMAAMGVALLMVLALVSVGVTFHEHVTDVQGADHTDCTACHFRHLPGVETGGLPGTVDSDLVDPDLVAHAVLAVRPDGEWSVALDIRSPRGPPL